MGRAPCCDKDGLKKGPWLPEEDQKLIDYIQKHGPGNWRNLPKKAGLERCGKSCRLRWTNYLRPDIKRGRFTFEEEETIIQLHSILGNKWSAIAAKLPGRTDNEIKNYWNTHIRKRLLRMGIDPVTHTRRLDLLDLPSILNSPLQNHPSQLNLLKLLSLQSLVNPELLKLATLLSTNQNENLNFLSHNNVQENHQLACTAPTHSHFNSVMQTSNQVHNQTPTHQTSPCVAVSGVAQVMEPTLEQYPQHISHEFDPKNFGHQTSSFVNDLWQNNVLPNLEAFAQDCDLDTTKKTHQSHCVSDDRAFMDRLFDDSAFLSDNSNQSLSFSFSPCSSQQTPLSSNSAHPNSSNNGSEDEIDSYCDNLLNFDIPIDLFDVCRS